MCERSPKARTGGASAPASIVIAGLLALTACTKAHSATPLPSAGLNAPLSSSDLRARVLTAADAPPGVAVSAPADDRHDYDSLGGGQAKPDCGELENMADFVFGATKIQPVGNIMVTVTDHRRPGQPWPVTERLLSYPAGGAHLVMRDLKDIATGCYEFYDNGRYDFAITPGPALGDESMNRVEVISETGDDIMESDAILIRTGDSMIILEGPPLPKGDPTSMAEIAAAAYHAFAGD